VQLVCALYLPKIMADIVDNGVRASDVDYIWSKGASMIVLSVVSLIGALCNTYLFSRISYKLGGVAVGYLPQGAVFL
jgi:ATP-binding cassette subfamily B protein